MLTKKENIFLAKKLFSELIYNSAYIEGCNVTFPQTQTIIDGAIVNGVSVDDIQTILNLRDAWKYILATIDEPLDIAYICKVNEFVSRNESLAWGVLRTGQISVSGTSFMPGIPEEEQVKIDLDNIINNYNGAERAYEYFCYAVKNQLFWDGNKRTSTLIANKILIEAGAGVLTIGKEIAEEFNTTLTTYYNTDNKEPLKACLLKAVKTLNK